MSRGKKTKKDSEAEKATSGRAFRHLFIVVLTLVAVAGLVWGVSRLGDEARRGIGVRERYSVRFAEIECIPPSGFDRSTFLSEVRYISNFPESFQSLDPNIVPKLTSAFTAHPWVEEVDNVVVEPNGAVRVKLKYRTAVLAVRTIDGTRILDGGGVLLPLGTDPTGLPELITLVALPTTSAGHVWADVSVKRAVELVDTHHPKKLEKTATGWRLTMTDGKTLILER